MLYEMSLYKKNIKMGRLCFLNLLWSRSAGQDRLAKVAMAIPSKKGTEE